MIAADGYTCAQPAERACCPQSDLLRHEPMISVGCVLRHACRTQHVRGRPIRMWLSAVRLSGLQMSGRRSNKCSRQRPMRDHQSQALPCQATNCIPTRARSCLARVLRIELRVVTKPFLLSWRHMLGGGRHCACAGLLLFAWALGGRKHPACEGVLRVATQAGTRHDTTPRATCNHNLKYSISGSTCACQLSSAA